MDKVNEMLGDFNTVSIKSNEIDKQALLNVIEELTIDLMCLNTAVNGKKGLIPDEELEDWANAEAGKLIDKYGDTLDKYTKKYPV